MKNQKRINAAVLALVDAHNLSMNNRSRGRAWSDLRRANPQLAKAVNDLKELVEADRRASEDG